MYWLYINQYCQCWHGILPHCEVLIYCQYWGHIGYKLTKTRILAPAFKVAIPLLFAWSRKTKLFQKPYSFVIFMKLLRSIYLYFFITPVFQLFTVQIFYDFSDKFPVKVLLYWKFFQYKVNISAAVAFHYKCIGVHKLKGGHKMLVFEHNC